MSKPRFARAFAVLLGWCALAAAADLLEPSPLDLHERLELRDPLMQREQRMFGDLRPRPLPGEREPLVSDPFPERTRPLELRP